MEHPRGEVEIESEVDVPSFWMKNTVAAALLSTLTRYVNPMK